MPARLLLLYNQPVLPADHPDFASERDVLDTVEKIDAILRGGGFAVERFGVGLDLSPFIDRLKRQPPDAVFNLFEGFADRPVTETTIAGILDWFGIPFTGNGVEALTLARDKLRTKYLLHGAGLPTAPFFSVDRLPCPPCRIDWPVIVKPTGQDASVGIEQASVATDQRALEAQVAKVMDNYGSPVLVEKFIRGREFFLPLFEEYWPDRNRRELRTLPPSEILFNDPSLWPIYSYAAKWTESSPEFGATPEQLAVDVPAGLADRLARIARQVYQTLGCRDYARVDFRVSNDGDPFVLELNPNPYILSIGLLSGLEAMGKAHAEFVCGLARAALRRGKAAGGEE